MVVCAALPDLSHGMTRPASTVAAEFLLELGFLDALDATKENELILLWSDFGLYEKERAMLLLEMALDAPVVGEAIFRMLSGENSIPVSKEANIRLCSLLNAQRALQKSNAPTDAKPEAQNRRLS